MTERTRHACVALAAIWSLAVAGAFVALDRDGAVSGEAAARGCVGLIVALAWGTAAVGAGGAVLARIAPALLEDGRGLVHSLVAGTMLWGLGGLGLGMMGLLGLPGIAGLAALLSAGWLARPPVRLPRVSGAALAAGAVILAPALVVALAPPVDTDELYQHLALPAAMIREGGLLGGPLHPDGSRPLGLHLAYACLLRTGGEAAPRLFHVGISAVLLAGVGEVGRAHAGGRGGVAALILAGSWTFLHGTGITGNDLPAALCGLAALDAALRGQARGLALAAGAALGTKYTAAGIVLGAFAVAPLPWATRIGAGAGALALVAPWWVRNAMEGLHPLFPFAGWPGDGLTFQYLEKYGAGRGPLDLLLLPWNAVMGAETDSFRFLGRLNPAFLALAPCALVSMREPGTPRRLCIAALIAGVSWAAGPHWLRYLIPALPALALAAAAALPASAMGRVAVLVCALAGLPANVGPVIEDAAGRIAAASGREARDEFLEREYDGWRAIDWANRHLPPDARVALLFDWSGYLLERRQVLGSVEDHVPLRSWLAVHGDAALADFAAIGITHVIVRHIGFIRKAYPFLSRDVFESAFVEPEAKLDALLLAEATLVFQSRRVAVYRLEES